MLSPAINKVDLNFQWINAFAKRFSFLIFNVVFLLGYANAQKEDPNFGVLQHSDISMTEYGLEPEAEAVILGRTKTLTYRIEPSPVQVLKYFERIKLFEESAFDLGEVVIEFYHADYLESLEELSAMITYPNGEMLELDDRNVKMNRIDNEWTQVLLDFPNLQKNCIIEYEYVLRKNYISSPEDFVFQSEIPIRYASFEYVIPPSIDYFFVAQGEEYINLNKNKFTMTEIPAIKEDAFVTLLEDYIGKIKTKIQRYEDPYDGYQTLIPKVDKMVATLLNDRLFGHQFTKDIHNRKLLIASQNLLDEEMSIIDKVNKLQEFILDNVSWDGSMELKCRKPINKLFKEGKASGSELNIMLLALLRHWEIDSYPVLVSTRNNGQAYSDLPEEGDFNHTIVLVELDGALMLFDVSDKLKPPSVLNFQTLNKYGLVVKADAPFWVKSSPELATDLFIGEFKVEDKNLKGVFRTKHSNYNAYVERDYTRDEDFLSHWKIAFQKRFPRAHLYDGSYENLDAIDKDFDQSFSLEVPGAIEYKSDSIFISPYLYGLYDENPFLSDKRGYEIDFAYPFSEQYVFRLEIPDAYELVSLPDNKLLRTPERMATFMVDPTEKDGQIQIVKRLEIKKAVFPLEETKEVMQLFKEVSKSTQEKIILVKKE